ncbi:hypothetical protein ACKI1H_28410 [Pseudomonas sp. YH-1]|uniref:hypothetical protein n=1 Tax=Pseudomonas sp. YH-1 TaxID=3384787 RepID=UPI003F7EC48F
MDALVYFVWEVLCYFSGLLILKIATLGKYKGGMSDLKVSLIGFGFFACIFIYFSTKWN